MQTHKNRRRYVHNILFEHSTVTQKVKLRFAETDQDKKLRMFTMTLWIMLSFRKTLLMNGITYKGAVNFK